MDESSHLQNRREREPVFLKWRDEKTNEIFGIYKMVVILTATCSEGLLICFNLLMPARESLSCREENTYN